MPSSMRLETARKSAGHSFGLRGGPHLRRRTKRDIDQHVGRADLFFLGQY